LLVISEVAPLLGLSSSVEMLRPEVFSHEEGHIRPTLGHPSTLSTRSPARGQVFLSIERRGAARAFPEDVQRLLYCDFLKCFWNEVSDYETNNMVDFDCYYPDRAWQHTDAELAGWLKKLGLVDHRFNDANPNGISVLLTKPLA
jgi:hypothetical protein